MSYALSIALVQPFDEVVPQVKQALAANGFGIVAEIDMQKTLKNKIGVEIEPHLILGACNPKMAHQAIGIEPKVGAMLPCNVIVRRTGGNSVMVSAIDPQASMEAIPNEQLKSVAGEVRDMLRKAVEAI